MAFEVEPTGEKAYPCDCCGQTSHTVWGLVHRRTGEGRAVYYVGWVDQHDERVVLMTLSLGVWGEGTAGADRRSVGIEIRAPHGVPTMGVVDEPFVREPELLGETLTRQEALDDPGLTDLWEVADAVVTDDPRVEHALVQLTSR